MPNLNDISLNLELVTTDKDKTKLRTFFKKDYPQIAVDVFPPEELENIYNSIIIKATNSSGTIVGGLLSCAPPALAEKASRDNSAYLKTRRLTFLELLSVEDKHPEFYVELLNFYENTLTQKNIKTIVGFTTYNNLVYDVLKQEGYSVLEPYEALPPLQGIDWHLPPTENPSTTVWFYKIL